MELEAAIAEVRQQQQQQQQQLNDQTLAPSSSRSSSDETSSFGTPTELLEQKLRTAVDALEKVERKLATQAGRLRAAEGDVERLTAELDAKEEIEESLMHDKEEVPRFCFWARVWGVGTVCIDFFIEPSLLLCECL